MTTAPRSNQILDENNIPVQGANIYVYDLYGNLVSLTSDGTTAIGNPLTTDQFGNYSYYATVNYYNEQVWFGGQLRWVNANVAVGQPGADLNLRTDLAVSSDGTKGAGLVNFNLSLSYPAGTLGAYLAAINQAVSFSGGVATFNNIEVVNIGSSSTPGLWLQTSLAAAWPGLLIENTIHSAVSQVQAYWKRWDASGNPLVWQACLDVDNNGGFKGLFNLEAIDITGPGVIATPISMARTGEVGLGGIPTTGVALSVRWAAAIGYGVGSGGAITQATSRTTGVTINKPNGQITLVSAAGSASWQTFTVTNSLVGATDTIRVCQASGTDLYQIHVTKVQSGSFNITFATTGGTTTEQPVFNFNVIKGAIS